MTTVFDFLDRKLVLEYFPRTIVSLVPSLTETIAMLGAGDRIVGTTDYCMEPVEIYDRIRSEGHLVGGPLNPDMELIKELEPDLVVMSREENSREDFEKLTGFCNVYVAAPLDVEDVLRMNEDFGTISGVESKAMELNTAIKKARRELVEVSTGSRRIEFAYLAWWDPAMVAGGRTYVSSLLECGPFSNSFRGKEKYFRISRGELQACMAEVILVPSEPYEFSDAEIDEVRNASGIDTVMRVDGRNLSWYGWRTLRGLTYTGGLIDELLK